MRKGFRKLIGGFHPRLAVVTHDLAMVWLAWAMANWLRLNMLPEQLPILWWSKEVFVVLIGQGLVLWWTGLYKGLWRFASLPDLLNIARAAVLGTLVIALGLFLLSRLEGVPRSILLIYPSTLFVLLGAPRLIYRYWKDSRLDLERGMPLQRVVILGAGRAGEALARDLKRGNRYRAVGFLDDKHKLKGARVQGVPVLGEVRDLGKVVIETAAEMLLIAMPSANNRQMQRIVEACEETGLPFRTVPKLQDIIEGRSGFNQIKEVAIEDLLGREPVSLDWTAIRSGLSNKRVLVTGGGGSIGSELCRQVARLGAESLAILDMSEYNLYRIEQELKRDFPEVLLHCALGDCADSATCERLLAHYRPHIVFHAAAYKHVPLLEGQAREAFRNNVLGTQTLALAASRHQAEHFVFISTDKAVNPSSIMGATKRAAEIFCQNFAEHSATRFTTVRFGNVLDSAGSVVPLFREQIQKGGPVTVTHPEISRYFMTIPESCQLILQAAVMGKGGEIFVLDMGEPVKIAYLAEQMIRLAGKIPNLDVEIAYTGLRPGEKLFEELFHEQETYSSTTHKKILLATARRMQWADLSKTLAVARTAVAQYDEESIMRCLRKMVPEAIDPAPEGNLVSIHRVNQSKDRA